MTKIFFYDKNFFLTKSFFMTKQSVRVHSRDVSRPKNDLRVFDKLRMKDSLTGISVRSLVFEPTKLGNPVENKYDQNHEPRRKTFHTHQWKFRTSGDNIEKKNSVF